MSLSKVIDIGLHLVGVEVRHKDAADTFLRFGWRNYILTRYALERLCDVDDFSLKVKIRRNQCKHFAKSQTAPIERFKSIIGSGLVLNSIRMLNYLTVLSQEINSSNNSRIFLESAYSSLINNTYPNAVDVRTEAHMEDLLDTLESFRMLTVKRERISYLVFTWVFLLLIAKFRS